MKTRECIVSVADELHSPLGTTAPHGGEIPQLINKAKPLKIFVSWFGVFVSVIGLTC